MLTRDYVNYFSSGGLTINDIAQMGTTIAIFDSYTSSSIIPSANLVSRWNSLKGSYYFEQSDLAKMPVYDSDNKIINFDTTAKVLSGTTSMAAITNNISKITVMGVCTYPSSNGWHLMLYISTGGTTASRIVLGQAQLGSASSVNKQALARRTDADTTSTLNSGTVGTVKSIQTISIDYANNTGKIYIDGALKSTNNSLFASGAGNTAPTNSNFVLLGQNNTGNYPLSGSIFCFAIGQYTDSERATVEKILAKRYNIAYLG